MRVDALAQRALEARDVGDRDVGRTLRGEGVLARALRVRVMRERVHRELLEAPLAARVLGIRSAQLVTRPVDAEQRLQERRRRGPRGAQADGRGLAEHDLVAAVAVALERVAGGIHEVAVDHRRYRDLAAVE